MHQTSLPRRRQSTSIPSTEYVGTPHFDSTGWGLALSNHQPNHLTLDSVRKPNNNTPQHSTSTAVTVPPFQLSLRTMCTSTLLTSSTKCPPTRGLTLMQPKNQHQHPPSSGTSTQIKTCIDGLYPRGTPQGPTQKDSNMQKKFYVSPSTNQKLIN
jgi:hypothetical protein